MAQGSSTRPGQDSFDSPSYGKSTVNYTYGRQVYLGSVRYQGHSPFLRREGFFWGLNIIPGMGQGAHGGSAEQFRGPFREQLGSQGKGQQG